MKKILLVALVLAAGAFLAVRSYGEGAKGPENPFFAEKWDTPFEVPPFDRIRPEHFKPAIEEGMRREEAEIAAIVDNPEAPTFENVILAYGNSGRFLDRVESVFGNLCSANLNDTLQAINEELTPLLSRHGDNIALNPGLFAKVKAVYDKKDSLNLDPQQKRLLEKVYVGFVRNGANLGEEEQAELRRINEALSKATMNFARNVRNDNNKFLLVIDRREDLAGLPEAVVASAAAEAEGRDMAGKWVFTLDKPSLFPFLQYSERRDLREKLYKGYLNKANYGDGNDNKALINEIVNLRLRKAKLLGYESHAAYVLDQNMAKTDSAVYAMLDGLWTPALKLAKQELKEMKAIKAAEGQGDDFESWDWWYYAEKLRKQKYDLDENEIRPYLALDNVRRGAFMVIDSLYGITFREIPDAPKYVEDNKVYEVIDKDGSHLGVLYMDFHPRAGKKVGAWCTRFRSQRYDENGRRVAPVSSVVYNFSKPAGDTPALLTLDEVNTLFHELGHAIHGLVSDVKLPGLARVSRDFVELPSQVMENWATQPKVLKMYAKHYRTGETIPNGLVEKIQKGALFNQGFATVENLAASLLDMDYHTLKAPQEIDVTAFEKEAMAKRGLMKEIEPRYRSTYFQHIFSGGYSAGYYSYLWAEVLDADAYQAFAESGDIFNPQIAASFRNEVLSKGGSEDEMGMYVRFRGKQPGREPLLKRRGLVE